MTDDLLKQGISPAVLEQTERFAQRFRSARPFRHVRIDSFLTMEWARSLAGNFPPFDDGETYNELGRIGGKSVHQEVTGLGPAWVRLDSLVRSKPFREWVAAVTGVPDLQYDPDYFGGGTHENLHGQALAPHIDFNYHPRTRQHRRLNLIVYLNEEWQDCWGGAIRLHRNPYEPPSRDDIVSIAPVFNRCVIFETHEHSWHGFRSIELPRDKRHLSRRSFALYYYTDTRPETETATEHSTIYVDDHLPEDLVPGSVLSEQRWQLVHGLVRSRDEHIRMLYGETRKLYARVAAAREAHTGQEETIRAQKNRIDELENSTSWRLTAPLRWLRQRLAR